MIHLGKEKEENRYFSDYFCELLCIHLKKFVSYFSDYFCELLCIHLKKFVSLQTHLLQYSLFMRTLKGKKIIEKKYICVRLILFFIRAKMRCRPPKRG